MCILFNSLFQNVQIHSYVYETLIFESLAHTKKKRVKLKYNSLDVVLYVPQLLLLLLLFWLFNSWEGGFDPCMFPFETTGSVS